MNQRLLRISAAVLAGCVVSACVHEWPEEAAGRDVTLHVTHSLGWTQHDVEVSRSGNQAALARYHFKIYPAGDPSHTVAEREFTSADLTRSEFTTTVHVPAGTYDLLAWSDYADASSSKSLFFDSSDFTSIWYPDPYNGNNELRDAFRGAVTFTVKSSVDADYVCHAELPLERPLARYEFVSTDLAEFLENEISRTEVAGGARGTESADDAPSRVEDIPLERYRVKMIYTGYMPSEFNNVTNRPVNSKLGMSYDAVITRLNDDEARLGFDYVMVNGHESSVPVALELYDPTGELIGRTNAIDVPTRRGRNTTVRGKFLTSKASGGVGINPDFDGEFNIEIK